MADLLQKLFGPKHKHSSSDGGKMADGEGYTKQQSEFCEFFCGGGGRGGGGDNFCCICFGFVCLGSPSVVVGVLRFTCVTLPFNKSDPFNFFSLSCLKIDFIVFNHLYGSILCDVGCLEFLEKLNKLSDVIFNC